MGLPGAQSLAPFLLKLTLCGLLHGFKSFYTLNTSKFISTVRAAPVSITCTRLSYSPLYPWMFKLGSQLCCVSIPNRILMCPIILLLFQAAPFQKRTPTVLAQASTRQIIPGVFFSLFPIAHAVHEHMTHTLLTPLPKNIWNLACLTTPTVHQTNLIIHCSHVFPTPWQPLLPLV